MSGLDFKREVNICGMWKGFKNGIVLASLDFVDFEFYRVTPRTTKCEESAIALRTEVYQQPKCLYLLNSSGNALSIGNQKYRVSRQFMQQRRLKLGAAPRGKGGIISPFTVDPLEIILSPEYAPPAAATYFPVSSDSNSTTFIKIPDYALLAVLASLNCKVSIEDFYEK